METPAKHQSWAGSVENMEHPLQILKSIIEMRDIETSMAKVEDDEVEDDRTEDDKV